MNKDRRKRLDQAQKILEDIKEQFDTARDLIRDVAEEEREAFDNLSEGLQQAERGQAMEAAADALDNAHSSMELDFDELIGFLDEAASS